MGVPIYPLKTRFKPQPIKYSVQRRPTFPYQPQGLNNNSSSQRRTPPGLGVSPAPSTSTLGDEDDFGLSRFDLSRVFSSLQVMKEKISEMTDDGERRSAAARVALGLVYGLQRDEDTDVQ
jgi:hypothetical protein